MVIRSFLLGVITVFVIANPIIGGVINTGFLISRANDDADLTMHEVPRNMVDEDAEIELTWDGDAEGDLRYSSGYAGPEPDQYRNVVEEPILSEVNALTIDAADLPVGIIFCIVDAGEDGHSAVFRIIRTASSAPVMDAPITGAGREGIHTVTPTFRWRAVGGVSFYHIIVSDQPFIITEDDEGTRVEGANIIWQGITSETSIMYGIPDPSEFFDADNIPPLIGHDEDHRDERPRYAWVVLNNYGNHPAYTSSVTGGISGFEVEVEPPFDPPENIAPDDSVDVNENEIIFRWTQVREASTYFIYVTRREITPGGSEALVPAWNAQTTETAIGCPAGDIFMAGRENEDDDDEDEEEDRGNFGQYEWKVIAANQQGRGAISEPYRFQYFVESGKVVFRTNTEDGAELQFVELTSQAVDGAALQPFSSDDAGYHERFVPVGTYQFMGNKIGYEEFIGVDGDGNEEIVIEDDGEYRVTFALIPLPATIIGSVIDDEGDPISSATVVGVNPQTDEEVSTETNISGEYQLDVDAGRWNVSATAAGFEPSDEIAIAVEEGDNYDMNAEHGAIELIPYTFTISGYVRNPAGQPIQLAQMNISNDEGAAFRTHTPEAGTYSFTVGVGEWIISAHKAGFYLESGNRPVEIVNRDLEENFTLVPLAGIISGQVFVDGNAANQNVDVWFIPDAGEVTITRPNQIGGYSQGVSPGNYTVTPVKEGYSTDDRIEISIGPGETISGVRLELWANPSSISGRIVDAGNEALPDADVSAAGVNTTSDGQGNYTLDVAAGRHTVSARKQGYATEEDGPISVEAGQDIENVNFRLVDNAGSISGRIRRGQDPIFEAIVTAVRDGDEATSRTTTNRNGNYSFGLRYGNYRITAEKDGFIARGNGYIDVQLQAGQEVNGRDFAMLNYSARITGTVRSAGGPVNSPAVRIIQLDDENRVYNSTGNVEGRFAVTVAPEAAYIVIATRDGYSSAQDTTDEMEVEGEVGLSFEIEALPSQISGRVMVNESPLAQVTVRADGEDDSYEAQTDGSGVYRLNMESGEYQLTASKPGYTQAEGDIRLSPGENRRNIDFELEENFSILAGTISDPDDERISDVTVILIETGGGGRANTESDQDGAFTFERILPGSYRIETEHPQYADGNLDIGAVVGGQERRRLAVTMEPLDAVIEGVVLVSGEPLENATVFASVEGNEFTARTDEDGEFIFPNVAQGRYYLLPGRAGFTAEPSDSVEVDPGDRINVELEMTLNDGLISVEVRDPDDAGLRGARVTAFDDQGHFASAETGAPGTVELENLYPLSQYSVTVLLAGYSTEDDTLLGVDTGDDVTFSMAPDDLELAGSTVNQAGDPIPETPVQATSLSDGSVFRATSDDNGDYSFDGLASNTEYRIQTHRFEDTYTNVDRVLALGENHNLDEEIVIIENSATITGNVSVREVSIEARHVQSGRTITVYSSADGSYAITRLRDGNYVMKAERIGYRVNRDSILVNNLGIGDVREDVDFEMTEIRISISGRVIDGLNSPVTSAPVLAWSNAGQFSDTTDQNGNFNFERLYPNQSYQVTSELPNEGYENNSVDVEVELDNIANVEVQIVRHNATFTGTVERSDGSPLSGVLAILDGELQETSNDTGVFVFSFLAGGEHALELIRAGYVPLSTEVNTEDGEGEHSETFVLEVLERAIYGMVSAGEFGHVHNSVVTATDDLGEVKYDTTANNGSFNFNRLEPDRTYEISASKRGFTSNQRGGLSVLTESVEANLVIELLASHINGNFLTYNDVIITGAQVILQSFNNTIQIDTTDFFGDFSIPVVGGNYLLLGVDPNDELLTSYNSNLSIGEGSGEYKILSLSNAGSINGQLVTEDGGPPVTAGFIISRHEATGILVFNWSSPDGSFRLRGLRPGSHVISVDAAGYAMIDGPITSTISANTALELTLILTQSGKAITGYITEANGDPVINARVNIAGPTPGTIETNEDGYYTLLGPEQGDYTISAEKFGYVSPADTTFFLEAGGIVQIDREMNPLLNAISGRIVDEFSDPLESVAIWVYFNDVLADSTFTNEFGEHQLSGLSPGSFRLVPMKEDHNSAPIEAILTLEQDDYFLNIDFRLTIVRGIGNVFGKVMHRGEPVVEAAISLINLDLNQRLESTSDDSGDFAFTEVIAPFSYRIRASVMDISEVSDSTFHLLRDSTITRLITFPSGRISVILTDFSSDPIPNRPIYLVGESINFDTTLFTDASGQAATIDWLEAGQYSVLPQSIGEELAPELTIVDIGRDEQVEVAWQMGWTVVPPPSFNFADSARVEIIIPDEIIVNLGNLYWRGPSEVIFSSKPLITEGAGRIRGRGGVRSTSDVRSASESSQDELVYFAFIPPQTRSGTLLFYLEVHTSTGLVYGGPNTVQEIQITNEGILDRLDLVRSMSVFESLQLGVPVQFQVTAFDNANNYLNDELGNDAFEWLLEDGGRGVFTIDPDDNSVAEYLPNDEGDARLRVSVTQDRAGVVIHQVVEWVNSISQLDRLNIVGPADLQVADGDSVRFTVAATDTVGASMPILPNWYVENTALGRLEATEFSMNAMFYSNSGMFGRTRIAVTDSLTGTINFYNEESAAKGLGGLQVYGLIKGDSLNAQTFEDGNGFIVQLPPGTLDPGRRSHLSVNQVNLPDVMKLTPEYEAVDIGYDLNSSEELNPGVRFTITIPIPEQQGLYTGNEPIVGVWDQNQVEWVIHEGQYNDDITAVVIETDQLVGLIALISASEPLDVRDMVFNPNPFSPNYSNDGQGLSIEFQLSSNLDADVSVTLKIYNMGGELIRTIKEKQLMPKGSYYINSPNSERKITWNGLTDRDRMARNGRYLIVLEAQDASGKKQSIGTAVLIK